MKHITYTLPFVQQYTYHKAVCLWTLRSKAIIMLGPSAYFSHSKISRDVLKQKTYNKCKNRISVLTDVMVQVYYLTWYNDDILGIGHHLYRLINIGLGMCPFDLHGFSSASGGSAKTTQNNIG